MFAQSPRPVPLDLHRPSVRVAPVSVPAGYPSPAQDYFDGDISLDDHLIEDRAATFILRVTGHSMVDAGIWDGDEILVDRSKTPRDGDVVVAVLDGELTVKRLRVTRFGVVLQAENTEHPDIIVPELSELTVWGCVTWVLHRLYR